MYLGKTDLICLTPYHKRPKQFVRFYWLDLYCA